MSNEKIKTKIELLNNLFNAWQGAFGSEKYSVKAEYISKKDQDELKKGVKLSHFYHTHVAPLPFWGNIYKPKYIVLSHNPSCEPIVDELESLLFYEKLKSTLKNPCDEQWTDENLNQWIKDSSKNWIKDNSINWLSNDYDLGKNLTDVSDQSKELGIETLKNKILKKYKTTYQWWNEIFDAEEFKNKNKIFEEVGFFNLCGYHSRSYVEVPQKFISKDNENIPTIRATIEYVQHLIKNKNKNKYVKIILVWGTEWKDYIYQCRVDKDNKYDLDKYLQKLESESRLLIVNKKAKDNSTRNKSIKKSIKCDKEYCSKFFTDFPGWIKKTK